MSGWAAAGLCKSAAVRAEVVESLLTHALAGGGLLNLRWRRWLRGMPRRAGVSLYAAGWIVAINVAISAAEDSVRLDCARRGHCARTMRGEIAFVAAHGRLSAMINWTA
jgi:hypothetical protein